LIKILILLPLCFNYARCDETSTDIIVKLKVESKYEFHNRFGEYLEILQYQIKTNYDKLGKVSSVIHYDGEGNLQSKDIYYYNKVGYLVELSSYGPDGLLLWKNILSIGPFSKDINHKIKKALSWINGFSKYWYE
jgi:hypothetical protein